MRNILIFASLFFSMGFTLSAQTVEIWQGGKPGRSTDWNCPANWSEGRVPDEFTQVIIPAGANVFPVIKGNPTPIDALLVEGGATLTIQVGAAITILGETGIFEGVTCFGRIQNNGILTFGEAMTPNVALLKEVQGNGTVINLSARINTVAKR